MHRAAKKQEFLLGVFPDNMRGNILVLRTHASEIEGAGRLRPAGAWRLVAMSEIE
jgi:hypothetical protein